MKPSKNLFLYFFIISIFSLSLVSAGLGLNDLTKPHLTVPVSTGNQYINNSYTTNNNNYYNGTSYNVSYDAGIKWFYNMTLPFTNWLSTFDYNYNQSDSIWHYNQTYTGGTFNATYNGLNISYNKFWYNYTGTGDYQYNQTYTGGTYNSSYVVNRSSPTFGGIDFISDQNAIIQVAESLLTVGGDLTIKAGKSDKANDLPGTLKLYGGETGESSAATGARGGDVEIKAGIGGSSDNNNGGKGGDVEILAGTGGGGSENSGNGGDVYIDGGVKGFLAQDGDIFLGKTRGNTKLQRDNAKLYFGTGDNASIYYDGTNLNINPGNTELKINGNISAEIANFSKLLVNGNITAKGILVTGNATSQFVVKTTNNSASSGYLLFNNLDYSSVLFKTSSAYTTYKTLKANDLGFFNYQTGAGDIVIHNDVNGGKVLLSTVADNLADLVVDGNGNVGVKTGGNQIYSMFNVGTGNFSSIGDGSSDPSNRMRFDNAYDSSGTATTNKLMFFNSSTFRAGFGVSVNDLDAYSGNNFKFWTMHTPTSEGNNTLTISGLNRVGIVDDNPSYSLVVNHSVSGISIWTLANVSADDYITRTEVFDKSKGTALSFIKDAEEYKTNGKINHSLFSYSSVSYDKDILSYSKKGEIDEKVIITTKKEEGVSLGKEIALLKQAIYELKIENQRIKDCAKEIDYKSYSECVLK